MSGLINNREMLIISLAISQFVEILLGEVSERISYSFLPKILLSQAYNIIFI